MTKTMETETVMTPADVKQEHAASLAKLKPSIAKAKVHYFRAFEASRDDGHNDYHGTHGKDPNTCKACVSVMVAEFTHDGKTYVGVSFRNDKDQVNCKIGRAIAVGRAVKNALNNFAINVSAFDELLRKSHKDNGTRDNLKFYWAFDMLKSILA